MANLVKYVANGVEQTLWKRLLGSKTFYTASAGFLGVSAKAAEMAVTGAIGWKAAAYTVVATGLGGAVVTFLRDGQAKAELAAHAANDSLPGVKALPTDAGR